MWSLITLRDITNSWLFFAEICPVLREQSRQAGTNTATSVLVRKKITRCQDCSLFALFKIVGEVANNKLLSWSQLERIPILPIDSRQHVYWESLKARLRMVIRFCPNYRLARLKGDHETPSRTLAVSCRSGFTTIITDDHLSVLAQKSIKPIRVCTTHVAIHCLLSLSRNDWPH